MSLAQSLFGWIGRAFKDAIDIKVTIHRTPETAVEEGCNTCQGSCSDKEVATKATEKKTEYAVAVVTPPSETPFEKAKKAFNAATDILVLSEVFATTLNPVEQQWLKEQGERVFFFKGETLINVALVSNGQRW